MPMNAMPLFAGVTGMACKRSVSLDDLRPLRVAFESRHVGEPQPRRLPGDGHPDASIVDRAGRWEPDNRGAGPERHPMNRVTLWWRHSPSVNGVRQECDSPKGEARPLGVSCVAVVPGTVVSSDPQN